MPILATEIWSDRRFVRGQSATRAWLVTGVTTEDQARTAIPVDVNSSHPMDLRLTVMPTPEVQTVSPNRAYKVVAQYGWNAAGQWAKPEDDPLSQPAKWSVEPLLTQSSRQYDAYAHPILNTAGDPYPDLVEDEEEVVLVAERVESTWDAAKWYAYRGAINTDAFTVPKVGRIGPGEARLTTYMPTAKWDRNSFYVPVVYKLWIRPGTPVNLEGYNVADGHLRLLLDSGFNGFYSGAGGKAARATFYDDEGEVTEPIRLDGRGRPLKPDTFKVGKDRKDAVSPSLTFFGRDPGRLLTTDEGVFIRYAMRKLMPFGGLNLDT